MIKYQVENQYLIDETRVIRLIKKIDKNPEFSNKTGIKNISEFTMEMQKKKVEDALFK